jgi:hypothetical protein
LLAGNDTAMAAYGPVVYIGGPGDDTLMGSPLDDVLRGGAGADTINGGDGNDSIYGDADDDNIDTGNGNDTVDPGPGIDNVTTGDGNDTVIIHDLCEVGAGEVLAGGAGTDTLITPVSVAQLQALGVSVSGFENVTIVQNSCASECVTAPNCSGHGVCTEGVSTGQVACLCDSGWGGANCDSVMQCPPDAPDCCSGPTLKECQCEKNGGTWSGGQCHLPNSWTSTIYPSYRVVTAFYYPPGNASHEQFTNANVTGTRQEFSYNTKFSLVASGDVTIGADAEVEGTLSYGHQWGESEETQITTSNGMTYAATPDEDRLDHNRDAFVIWQNPALQVSDDGFGNYKTSAAMRPNESPRFIVLSVAELLGFGNLSCDPTNTDPYSRCNYLKNLPTADKIAIVRLNPWADAYLHWYTYGNVNGFTPDLSQYQAGNGTPRFLYQKQIMVQGNSSTTGIYTQDFGFQVDQATAQKYGNTYGGSLQVMFSGGFSFFGILGGDLKTGAIAEFEYENTIEQSMGTQKQYTASLGSSTHCWHQAVDVFADAVFGNYVYVAQDYGGAGCDPAYISGRVVDSTTGAPVPRTIVTLALTNGKILEVGTDANGIYRAVDVDPKTVASVTTAPGSNTALVQAGQFTYMN